MELNFIVIYVIQTNLLGKDRDWQSNFLKYTAILYSFNLEAIDITFTQMADAIEEIKYLNRSEIFEWLCPNLHPDVEVDADY